MRLAVASAPGGGSLRPRLGRLRVLVVEDHDESRELLRVLLLQHGADVTAVPSAEEALDLCRALAYDVIVSDLRLPGQDGCAFLTAVRNAEQGRERAVFAIAYSEEPFAEASRALRHGFDSVVTKPAMDRVVTLLGHVAATLGS